VWQCVWWIRTGSATVVSAPPMTAVHCPLASQSQSVTVELNTYNWAPVRTAVTSRRVGASHCILGCQVLALATGYALCCGADCLIPIPDSFLRFTCQRQRLTLGSYRGIDSGLISFSRRSEKKPSISNKLPQFRFRTMTLLITSNFLSKSLHREIVQEAQLSPRDRAMRRVS